MTKFVLLWDDSKATAKQLEITTLRNKLIIEITSNSRINNTIKKMLLKPLLLLETPLSMTQLRSERNADWFRGEGKEELTAFIKAQQIASAAISSKDIECKDLAPQQPKISQKRLQLKDTLRRLKESDLWQNKILPNEIMTLILQFSHGWGGFPLGEFSPGDTHKFLQQPFNRARRSSWPDKRIPIRNEPKVNRRRSKTL